MLESLLIYLGICLLTGSKLPVSDQGTEEQLQEIKERMDRMQPVKEERKPLKSIRDDDTIDLESETDDLPEISEMMENLRRSLEAGK